MLEYSENTCDYLRSEHKKRISWQDLLADSNEGIKSHIMTTVGYFSSAREGTLHSKYLIYGI